MASTSPSFSVSRTLRIVFRGLGHIAPRRQRYAGIQHRYDFRDAAPGQIVTLDQVEIRESYVIIAVLLIRFTGNALVFDPGQVKGAVGIQIADKAGAHALAVGKRRCRPDSAVGKQLQQPRVLRSVFVFVIFPEQLINAV